MIDRHLRQFGPEAKAARDLLRVWADDNAAAIWAPEGRRVPTQKGDAEWAAFHGALRTLAPTNDAQRSLQTRILNLADELTQTRLVLEEQSASSIQMPFLLVVVLWLAVIYASFGIFAPRNGTVYAVILLSALSLSTAVFLILELDSPFEGVIRISDVPYRTVMKEFGR